MSIDAASLETLAQAIGELQDIIGQHRPAIGRNETRTRTILIDPLLKALGWTDPSVLTQEYLVRYGSDPADYGVVDYAIHKPNRRGSPIAFVEAKRMDEELNREHRAQLFAYARKRESSVQKAMLTNGDIWELYELEGGEFRRVLTVSIRQQSARECAAILAANFSNLTSPAPQTTSVLAGEGDKNTSDSVYESESFLDQRISAIFIFTAFSWFVVSFFASAVAGYIAGFRESETSMDVFAALGAAAAGLGVIGNVFLGRSYVWAALQGIWRGMVLAWQHANSLAARRGRALMWLGVNVIGGIAIGAPLGYTAGEQTAQPLVDALAGLGEIVLQVIIIASLLFLLFWWF